jgi:hypothetical protein
MKKKVIMAMTIVLLIFAIGGLCYYLFVSHNDKKTNNSNTTNSTSITNTTPIANDFTENDWYMRDGGDMSTLTISNISGNSFQFDFFATLDVWGDGQNVRTGEAKGTAVITSKITAEYVVQSDNLEIDGAPGAKISFTIEGDKIIVTADDNKLPMGANVIISGTYTLTTHNINDSDKEIAGNYTINPLTYKQGEITFIYPQVAELLNTGLQDSINTFFKNEVLDKYTKDEANDTTAEFPLKYTDIKSNIINHNYGF